jgi:hypothetical protein
MPDRDKVFTKTSMLYWYQKIQLLNIPQPKTEIVMVGWKQMIGLMDGKKFDEKTMKAIGIATSKIGYPMFLRTDVASHKHDWKHSSYVASGKELSQHVFNTVDFNLMEDLSPVALVFREILPLKSTFKAFAGELPIAVERRYFVEGDKVLCHHEYWIEDAIADWYDSDDFRPFQVLHQKITPDNWRELLKEINHEYSSEINLLSDYAARIGKTLGGFWSVDFALADRWYLIDMAEGEKSYHKPDCPNRKRTIFQVDKGDSNEKSRLI